MFDDRAMKYSKIDWLPMASGPYLLSQKTVSFLNWHANKRA
jgi:hypothetical protein